MNKVMINIIVFDSLQLLVNTSHFHKIAARNIYRNRNKRKSILFPADDIAANLLYNKAVEFCDKAVPFKKRNKLRRRHKTIFRMIPAHKRFCSGYMSADGFVFRLVENLELFFFKSPLHCFNNSLFVEKSVLQVVFKKR